MFRASMRITSASRRGCWLASPLADVVDLCRTGNKFGRIVPDDVSLKLVSSRITQLLYTLENALFSPKGPYNAINR